jgi:hypothetical protein
MNFVVGSILYHASEFVAFWIYVQLLEECEVRDIYLPGLPGMFKHTKTIDRML